MVRTTIACAWCRRSKVKCLHDGAPPCRNCLKNRRIESGECILEGPFDSRTTNRQSGSSVSHNSPSTPRILSPRPVVQPLSHVPIRALAASSPSPVFESRARIEAQQSCQLPQDIISSLPTSTIIQSASIFARKFPELAFIHLSSFSGSARSYENVQRRVHIAAILSLCSVFLPTDTANLQSPETYAAYTRDGLSRVAIDPPSITIVQTMLTIAMYEWGNGNGYGSWMYSGMAIRVMQSIQLLKHDRSLSERESDTQNRTFWACFVMDRLIFCGKSQPLVLPMDRMTIHLPVGDLDFAFGKSSSIRYTIRDIYRDPVGLELHNNVDHRYSVLIRGFDICAKVLELVISGGRRQAGMSKPENCPWVSSSPWNILYRDLEKWRTQQCQRLQYPLSPVATHVSLGHGESVAYINLLYFVCILFLNREYIPLLPTPTSEPEGPVDPPLLEAKSPDGWWSDRARDLFHAATCITTILEELDELDSLLLTPFAGFCVFSAATMNIYVAEFPQMNLGRSSNAKVLAELNIAYLDKFRRVWKMGNGWWKTIQQTRILYTRASADRSQFNGKTRADFLALETSMHDYSGASPVPDDVMIQEANMNSGLREVDHSDQQAAISLQELSSAGVYEPAPIEQPFLESEMDDSISNEYGIWNDVWSIWGDNQFLPVALGNFEFNADTVAL